MQPSAVQPGRLGRRDAVAAAVLAGLTIVVFLRALDGGFINFDDTFYVVRNRNVTGGLTPRGLLWAFTAYTPYYWHPLTWLSLQLDATFSWPSPWGFLLTNVLLHAANAAALFLALRLLTGAFWPSAAAALLFAVHPLRVESVAWVTERKDVLSGLFGLLTLAAYAWYAGRPSTRRYLVVAGAFALSLMAKPMLVTLPVLLLALDWWPLGRWQPTAGGWQPLRRLALEKLPLLVMAVASAAITLEAHRESNTWTGLERLGLLGRVENATVSYAKYVVMTVWPVNLAIYYPHPLHSFYNVDHLPAGQLAGAGLLLAALTAAAVALRRRAPYLLVGWAWYVLSLAPVSGLLVQSGGQAYADRFTYFPQIGLLVAACWGVADLAGRHATGALRAAAAVAAVLAVLSWHQLSYWSDPNTLWRHAIDVAGRNPVALNNLAQTVSDEEAAGYFRQVLEVDPKNADAHLNLGTLFQKAGRLDDAEREHKTALLANPKAEGGWGNLGNVALQRRQYDRAADLFREQLKVRESAEGHCNLGAALNYLGNVAEAEAELRAAVRLDPDLPSAHTNLGAVLQRQKRLDEAAAEERTAIELDPQQYEPHYQLALIEIERRNFAAAVESLKAALRVRPESLDALVTLGGALLEQGRPDESLAVMTEVVKRRPQDGPIRFNLGKVLEECGQLDGAAAQYEAATRLTPALAQAWYDLGRLRARQGRQGDAIASFEQAAARDPSSDLYRKALAAARRPPDPAGAATGPVPR